MKPPKEKKIKASDLPTEVLTGFETSDFSDMKILEVQKMIAHPLKDSEDPYRSTPEDSLMEGKKKQDTEMLDSAYADRPYRMREDNLDIAETYYQATYDSVETLSDSLMVDDVYRDKKNTFYEIEVDSDVAS